MNNDPSPSGTQPAGVPAPQPVAYDTDGHPLYEAPNTQYAHNSQAVPPVKPAISPEIKSRHDESKLRYPFLNLSDGEYVVRSFKRHWIGLLVPVVVTGFMVALIVAGAISYPLITSSFGDSATSGFGIALIVGLLLALLFLIGGYIIVWVYLNNKLFLTNENVIQIIQDSLFAKREQTVNLANIIEVSYSQVGLPEIMLNYGTIRFSTQGDEKSFGLGYIVDPKQEVAVLNNAAESFKNGRPIQ